MKLTDFEKTISHLINSENPVNRVFNSIGSHIFLEFGKEQEITLKNGRKTKRKEWSIWVGNASWRITYDDMFLVGSGDESNSIGQMINKLLGKRFLMIDFTSQFLDVKFQFGDGYRLETFINNREEDQWTVFSPDSNTIGIDSPTLHSARELKKLSNPLSLKEEKKKNIINESFVLLDLDYVHSENLVLNFDKDLTISFETCVWRIEKKEKYCAGSLDDPQKQLLHLKQFIGKKLTGIYVKNTMMDVDFVFEENELIKTFTCVASTTPWKIQQKGRSIFGADVPLY